MQRPVFVHHPDQGFSIGDHVFPIRKYGLVRARLLAEGDTVPADWRDAPLATRAQLATVHTAAYLDDLEQCRTTPRTAMSELPLTPEIVAGFTRMAGGTLLAAREALVRGIAVNVGGGFHHAFADRAEGFCYLNDLAVAIRVLLDERAIARAAVIDLDVHQGNGTAHIFRDDPRVFTFSMHQEDLYPVKQHSSLDLGLENPIGDARYLALLAEALPAVYERGRPDLVLHQAGADPFEEDRLGNLGLTKRGLAQRDELVLASCAGRGVPCAVTLGGGYAVDPLDTVDIHVATCRAALARAAAAPARP